MKRITKENKTVKINEIDGFYNCYLLVNVKYDSQTGDLDKGDMTNLTWSGSTLKGAERWASKQLNKEVA